MRGSAAIRRACLRASLWRVSGPGWTTREGLRWALAGVMATAAVLVAVLALPSPWNGWPIPDLQVYAEGARLLVEGADPYGRPLGMGNLPYTYPPFSLIVFLPLTVVTPGLLVLGVGNTALMGAAIWAVLRTYPARGMQLVGVTGSQAVLGAGVLLGAQFLQPVPSNTRLGQINVLLMSVICVDLLAVRARGRGILTGITAMVKLTPLVFVLYPLWSRQGRTLRNFLVTVAVCLALSLVVMWGITERYFSSGIVDQDLPGRTYPGVTWNQSLRGMALRIVAPGVLGPAPGVSTVPAELMWVCSAILVGVLLLLALRGLEVTKDQALGLSYLAVLGVLVSPVSWTHHWVWIVPLAAAAWWSARRFPLVAASVGVLAVTMIGEPWFVRNWMASQTLDPVAGLVVNNLYVWGGLLVLLTGAWYGLRGRTDGRV